MLHLSLLTDKGLILPEEQAIQIHHAMMNGTLFAKACTLTNRDKFHPYVADKREEYDFPIPVAIHNEADALSLIERAESLYRESNTTGMELVAYVQGSSGATPPEPFLIARYDPDADADGLSLLDQSYCHLDTSERHYLMTLIHAGLAVVSGHQLLYLSEKTDDVSSIVDWPYPTPVSVVSGPDLKVLIDQASANSIVENLVSILLEVRLLGNPEVRYFVERYKPYPHERTGRAPLRVFDWLDDEFSIFHSLKYRGKLGTEDEIIGSLESNCTFQRRVHFGIDSLDEGHGEPFMPWVTLSVHETSPNIEKIDHAIRAFSKGDFKRNQVDRFVSWGFYPGEGPFAHTTFVAAHNIDSFTPIVSQLLQGVDTSDVLITFHIDLLK